MVATPLAAEGLDVVSGQNALLEDEPANFAEAVCRLLANAPQRQALADNGLQTLRDKYTWEAAWVTLDTLPQVTRVRELSSYTG